MAMASSAEMEAGSDDQRSARPWAERVSRGRGASARGGPVGAAPRPLHYATIALLAWLPMPIGGHAAWAPVLAATATGLLLFVWLIAAWEMTLAASTAGMLVALHALTDFSLLMPAVAMIFAAVLGIGCAQSRAS